jgi:hypothetical protein
VKNLRIGSLQERMFLAGMPMLNGRRSGVQCAFTAMFRRLQEEGAEACASAPLAAHGRAGGYPTIRAAWLSVA